MIVLCGRNGSGKTTVAKKLIEEYGYRKFPSTTTRAPRLSDLPGEYEHVSPEEFLHRQGKNLFAWHVSHAGASYGTERERLRTALLQKEAHWVDIVVPAATDMHEAYAREAGASLFGKDQNVFYFYLWVASEETLRGRIVRRGESRAEAYIKLRASREFNEEVRKINQRSGRFSIVESEHQDVARTTHEILSVVNHWGT